MRPSPEGAAAIDEPSDLDWIIVAVATGAIALAALVAYLIARVIREAESREDRRRYALALLIVFGSPVVLAAIPWSIEWLRRSGGVDLHADWWMLGNMAAAVAFSASAAFVIPPRSPRERGFAVVGGAAVGFTVYGLCVARGPW